jgi:glycosyltransferase involved in cell wall biosynthesis
MTATSNNLGVGIDLTPLLPYWTGVDTYLVQLVLWLNRIDRKTRYSVFVNWEDRKFFKNRLGENFGIFPTAIRNRVIRLLAQQFLVPALSNALKLHVLHSPSFFMPWFKGKHRHVLTVHDMTMFSIPMVHTRFRRSFPFLKAVTLSIRRAHLLIVPSRFVRDEIVRLLPDVPPKLIRVISHGVEDCYKPPVKGEVNFSPSDFKGNFSYILFAGTIEPRKNLKSLIEGYGRAVRCNELGERLVLAGKMGWDYHGILSSIRRLELRDRVHFTGYVDQATLISLYRNARLFIFPSIQEGFGLPPLEAMACGTPTIAADTSSLRENLLGAAMLVPPDDPDAIARAIDRMLRDQAVRDHYQRKGFERVKKFRWEETAKKTLDCYRELAG